MHYNVRWRVRAKKLRFWPFAVCPLRESSGKKTIFAPLKVMLVANSHKKRHLPNKCYYLAHETHQRIYCEYAWKLCTKNCCCARWPAKFFLLSWRFCTVLWNPGKCLIFTKLNFCAKIRILEKLNFEFSRKKLQNWTL